MTAPRVLEIRAGQARDFKRPAWDHHPERVWRSAYDKHPLAGAVRIGQLGVAGDEQFDRAVHGGPYMAVLAYAVGHYPDWRVELDLPEIGPGGFGENLVVEGLDERSVAIGDLWRVGGVMLQVSQPRGPCAAISRRWDREDLMRRVTEKARAGWYLRVIKEGTVEAPQPIEQLERPHPEWTVERVFRARIGKDALAAADRAALHVLEALSPGWREKFA